MLDVDKGEGAGGIDLAVGTGRGANAAAGRELDVRAIDEHLVARDFGTDEGRAAEVEVITGGEASGAFVGAIAGDQTAANLHAAFAGGGRKGRGCNDGRQERGCNTRKSVVVGKRG